MRCNDRSSTLRIPTISSFSKIALATAIFVLYSTEDAQCFSIRRTPFKLFSKNDSKSAQRKSHSQLNERKQKCETVISKQERIWSERYNELCSYVFDNGDCLVPLSYGNNTESKLGIWVRSQRRSYSYYMKGDYDRSFLTVDRIQALDGKK